MDENTTATADTTTESEYVETPNTTAAVVGGTLLGVATVVLVGQVIRMYRNRRAEKAAAQAPVEGDLEN